MPVNQETLLLLRAAGVARRDARLAMLVNPSAIVSHGLPNDPSLIRLQQLIIFPILTVLNRQELVY